MTVITIPIGKNNHDASATQGGPFNLEYAGGNPGRPIHFICEPHCSRRCHQNKPSHPEFATSHTVVHYCFGYSLQT